MANTERKPAKGKPISSHPLFPAVVALWFGALFGLGSLAIRPTLIEGVVLKTGLDLIVPAAAPPLGVTARILIALIMASLGAAIGAILALRLNRPKVEPRERKRTAANPGVAAEAEASMWNQRDVFTDGPARRPISAHEELGETLDSPSPLVGRRRPLAVKHEDRPFEPHDFAPLPGGEPQIFDIAATRLAPVGLNETRDHEQEPAPLDLGAFPAPAPVILDAPFAPPQPQPAPTLDWAAVPVAPVEPVASPMLEREVPVVAAAPRIFGMVAEEGHVPTDFVRAAGFKTSVFETEPVEPLFASRDAEPQAPAAAGEPALPEATAVAAPASALALAGEPQPSPADLGMTDLARRLQESMARRRAAKAEPAPAIPEPPATTATASAFVMPPPPPGFAQPEATPAAQGPEIPPAPIPMPAALHPVHLDHRDDEEAADLAALMPRHLTMPAPVPAEEAADADIEPPVPHEDSYASLLNTDMPRQEFVRVEEPEDPVAAIEPVVIFPGQMAAAPVAPLRPFDAPAAAVSGAPVAPAQAMATVDPAEAERALRLALANLQRISGAA